MKNHILFKTNVIICLAIVVGFVITAVLSYRANYDSSLESIEQVSSLTSEGIYYQLTSIFTRPVNVSLTMANDSLLKECLRGESAGPERAEEDYERVIAEYLDAYRIKYSYDSVFLVSTATGKYYNFSGVDRVMNREDPENVWYYTMLESELEYSLNVDNDEVEQAGNAVTVFVNCKIRDDDGGVLGIVGVGLRVDYLQELLRNYEEEFNIEAFLVDEQGIIQISTGHTGYEKIDMFEAAGLKGKRDQVLGEKDENLPRSMWLSLDDTREEQDFFVTRYISELSWYLIVEQDTGIILSRIHNQLFQTALIILSILVVILGVITYVIRGFNRQIIRMTRKQEATFRKATEEMYENIYELNITGDCAAGKSTERYFESIGIPGRTPYHKALEMIAGKQIKEEYREGYINTFSPENVIREYENGNTHLSYDFLITENGNDYYWMRIDANIYFCVEDNTIRMYTYRKNIDQQKRQEELLTEQIRTDAMTGIYNKVAMEKLVNGKLSCAGEQGYALFVFDIDNFKLANDLHGHAFGDAVIQEFVRILKMSFRQDDILGRIGGDEFAALIPAPGEEWVQEKAEELSKGLCKVYVEGLDRYQISASIGIALSPRDGRNYAELFRKADEALYETKRRGKNGFTLYS